MRQLERKTQAICVSVDSNIHEKTSEYKAMEDDIGNNIKKKVIGSQHHLTITYELGICSGEYLSHKTLPMTGCTGEVIAQHVYNALEELDNLESVRAILVDNASVNSDWKNGLVVKLEDELERNLHTISCALHQNKLSFRAIFKKLDGATTEVQSFSGPLGKKCKESVYSKPQIVFESIKNLCNIVWKKISVI